MSVLIHNSLSCEGFYNEDNGQCYENLDDGCPQGKKLDLPKLTCICQDGFSLFPRPGSGDNTTCYQWFTKGFCEGDKILTKTNSEPCQNNTCGQGERLHMSVSMVE